MLSVDDFIFVEYRNIPYPQGFPSHLQRLCADLDKEVLGNASGCYLDTEDAGGSRKLDSGLLMEFDLLRLSQSRGVPQLWRSEAWAEEFAAFLIALIGEGAGPSVIEIHPPFDDYCDLDGFLRHFRVFAARIHARFPEVKILIENRAGSRYKSGKPLVRSAAQIADLCRLIEKHRLPLGIALDIPQLLAAEHIDPSSFDADRYEKIIAQLLPHRHHISALHIWGKARNSNGGWKAHAGTLNTWFGGDHKHKQELIRGIQTLCADEKKRYLVPEVNSGKKDLHALVRDLFKEVKPAHSDDAVIRYMANKGWRADEKKERKRYLYQAAQRSKSDNDIAGKIGGMLIYNQVIEQMLVDIVEMSIHYIKAEIWPVSVELEVDLEKATFGKLIEYFKQFATVEPNRELILSYLKKYNLKRNQVVHDLFDFQDLEKLALELNAYAELADEIIRLLSEYDSQVCENFCQLEKRGNFTGSEQCAR